MRLRAVRLPAGPRLRSGDAAQSHPDCARKRRHVLRAANRARPAGGLGGGRVGRELCRTGRRGGEPRRAGAPRPDHHRRRIRRRAAGLRRAGTPTHAAARQAGRAPVVLADAALGGPSSLQGALLLARAPV
ncbi:hypothetical protein LV779_19250 [Streptomyces thinghirensis]|nr:hypothetical protein [Streptomyces thinghirensis]